MASSSSDLVEKERVLEQFRELTLLDREKAARILEKSKWSLDNAASRYFSETPENDEGEGTADNPIEILDTPEKTPQAPRGIAVANKNTDVSTDKTTTNPSISSDSNLKLLSWNIDGLHEEQLGERLRYIIKLIKTKQPDVVFLQEVITGMLELFRLQLPEYQVLPVSEPNVSYYNVILVRPSTTITTQECQLEFFQTSEMSRHYLRQTALFQNKIKLVFMTSHLESMKEYAAERKRQLADMFKVMFSEESDAFVIFGGDLNVRDKEVNEVGVSWRLADVWEACGSDPTTQYTWDTSINHNLKLKFNSKLRFDRIYIRNDSHMSLRPLCFTLVGKERLASGMFPSDHWGLWCEFKQTTKKSPNK